MKRLVKRVVASAGLLEPGRCVYGILRHTRPSVLARELRYRVSGLPDGFAAPPPGHIYLIIGTIWSAVYYDSGRAIVARMMQELRQCGVDPDRFTAVLDFGCGCGRLIRHLHLPGAQLYGTDYNPDLVAWCNRSLPGAVFSVNSLAPPLTFPDASLDWIYARSVFTHLDDELQRRWMAELRRVLRRDGIVYLTTHGRATSHSLTREELRRFEAGEMIVQRAGEEGTNRCSTFHPLTYVRDRLAEGFVSLGAFEGTPESTFLQDVHILQKQSG